MGVVFGIEHEFAPVALGLRRADRPVADVAIHLEERVGGVGEGAYWKGKLGQSSVWRSHIIQAYGESNSQIRDDQGREGSLPMAAHPRSRGSKDDWIQT